MKKSIIILIASLVTISVQAEPELKGSPAQLSNYLNGVSSSTTIRVSSKKIVKSDKAQIHFVVSSSEDTLREAIDENSSILGKIKNHLGSEGIDPSTVTSKSYSTLPSYSFYSKKPTSYTAKKTVSVTVKNEAELIKVLSVLEKFNDETRFLRMTFDFSEQEKAEKELLMENLGKAAEKKSVYEKALGVKLRVKTFSEGVTGKITPEVAAIPAMNKYLSTGIRTMKSDSVQWQQQDQSQKGFAEFEIVRELEITYFVED